MLGCLAPVYVVERMTGLSRSRVDFLVATGVFLSHRQYGFPLIEMKSVESWYIRRAAKLKKLPTARK